MTAVKSRPSILILGVLYSLLLSLFSPALAAAQTWLEIDSGNFTVISNGRESQAREIAGQFERIRQVFQKALPGVVSDPGQPIVILACRDERTMRELLPHYWEDRRAAKPAGVFTSTPERHFVVLRMDARVERPYGIVYHEYFHLLINLNLKRIPLWLNEGLAEFYANTDFSGQRIRIGLPSLRHIDTLRRRRPLPLEDLLSVDQDSPIYSERDKSSIFYAHSWALVHYLTMSGTGGTRESMVHLIDLLREGVDEREAVRQALGDLSRLEEAVNRYIRRDSFYYAVLSEPITVDPRTFRLRTLPPAESAAQRGILLAAVGRPEDAERLIREAISLDPNLAEAYEGLGYLRHRAGQRAEALAAFRKAVELDSRSYLAHYFLATLQLQDSNLRVDSPEALENILRRALELRPGFSSSYASLANLLLEGEDRIEEALQLAEKATQLEPGRIELLSQVGYAYVKANRMDEARQVIEEMTGLAESGTDSLWVDVLRQMVDSLEAQRSERIRYEESLRVMDEEARAVQEALASRSLLRARGRIVRVTCQAPASLELHLETDRGELSVESKNYNVLRFFVQGTPTGTDFHPCTGLEGKEIEAAYELDGAYRRLVTFTLFNE